jgi:hypothetical protein
LFIDPHARDLVVLSFRRPCPPAALSRRCAEWDNATMNDPRGNPSRRRLQALLQIPEKERTEAQWDEINELEIGLASGNRPDAAQHAGQRGAPPTANPSSPGGRPQGKKFKKFRNRPPNRGAT